MSSKTCAKKRLALATASLCAGLLTAKLAVAANPESVTADITFVDVITITENSALVYGLVDDALANTETIIVSTASAVSGTGAARVIGTPAAANLTVTATAGQPVSILVNSISSGTGYALSAFTCDYNGGATTGTCSGTSLDVASPVASATLLIGATLTGDGNAAASSSGADGSFNVSVNYQ